MAVLRQEVPVDVIHCDHPQCTRYERQYVNPGGPTIRDTARDLFGWSYAPPTRSPRVRARDLCPDHKGSAA